MVLLAVSVLYVITSPILVRLVPEFSFIISKGLRLLSFDSVVEFGETTGGGGIWKALRFFFKRVFDFNLSSFDSFAIELFDFCNANDEFLFASVDADLTVSAAFCEW
uniref:Uncharacterized protein n=1 Tax=Glossina pallidipes TaxID=7398 RepID=A0A1B0A9X4_GLOPL